MEKRSLRQITLKLKSDVRYNRAGGFAGGGILNTSRHVEAEMWVEIMDDPVWDRDREQWGVTGRPQIHVGSTRRALRELGTFFARLSRIPPA
jgi:hypothetical protein